MGLSGDLNGDYLIAPQCLARENFQILHFVPIANASTDVFKFLLSRWLEILRMNKLAICGQYDFWPCRKSLLVCNQTNEEKLFQSVAPFLVFIIHVVRL